MKKNHSFITNRIYLPCFGMLIITSAYFFYLDFTYSRNSGFTIEKYYYGKFVTHQLKNSCIYVYVKLC